MPSATGMSNATTAEWLMASVRRMPIAPTSATTCTGVAAHRLTVSPASHADAPERLSAEPSAIAPPYMSSTPQLTKGSTSGHLSSRKTKIAITPASAIEASPTSSADDPRDERREHDRPDRLLTVGEPAHAERLLGDDRVGIAHRAHVDGAKAQDHHPAREQQRAHDRQRRERPLPEAVGLARRLAQHADGERRPAAAEQRADAADLRAPGHGEKQRPPVVAAASRQPEDLRDLDGDGKRHRRHGVLRHEEGQKRVHPEERQQQRS